MTTWWEERTARVSEAIDLVSVQVDCSAKEALHLLRERAEQTGADLEDTALAVNGRHLNFSRSRVG